MRTYEVTDLLQVPVIRVQEGKGKKGKVFPVPKYHALKTYWGSGGIAPRILDLGIRWKWVVSFTPRPLYPRSKSPRHPLDLRLGGPPSRSGRGGEEKIPCSCRESNPSRLVRSLVTILTELPQLLYEGIYEEIRSFDPRNLEIMLVRLRCGPLWKCPYQTAAVCFIVGKKDPVTKYLSSMFACFRAIKPARWLIRQRCKLSFESSWRLSPLQESQVCLPLHSLYHIIKCQTVQGEPIFDVLTFR
jgi:hypothetical protein